MRASTIVFDATNTSINSAPTSSSGSVKLRYEKCLEIWGNAKGLWYLAAVEGKTLKAFAFARISQLGIDEAEIFKPQADITKRVADEGDIWFTEQKIEVLLRISPRVAHYFESRELLPLQRVREKAADGSLLLECQAAHPTQILVIVRSWIPNVRIVSPSYLADELNASLTDYLQSGQA